MPGASPPAESAAPGRRPGRAFRFRVHIATLFVALVATVGLTIVGYGYLATSHILLAAGDEEFADVAARTASQVRNLLTPALLLVQLLARHPVTTTPTMSARLETLPMLTAAMTEHPEISAVYVGRDNGDFFLVRTLGGAVGPSLGAPPGAQFLVQIRAPEAPVGGRYIFLDARRRVLRDDPEPDYRFDPRTRDWFRLARESSTTVRTAPYVFFTTREVGTTLAQRTADSASVVGVDITLRDLSRQLAQTRLTPSARLALVDGRGIVVAHPDVDRLLRSAPGGDGGTARLSDLADTVLGPLFAARVRTERATPLEVGGRAWIGAKRDIAADAGDPLILLLAVPRDELVAGATGLATRQVLIGLGVVAVAFGLVWLFARRISHPLEALSRAVEQIGHGHLDAPLPDIWNPVEVGNLIEVTDRMRVQIKGHIEERAARLADEHRRARELEIARQIQQSMLPVPLREPRDGPFAIAATLRPAREVGGDLYDFFLEEDHRLAFAIGDVADKGVPAALLMARVTGLLRVAAQAGARPDQILRELDRRLSEGNDACMFVTAACGQLDGESGEFWLASAGHERPLLRRVDGSAAPLAMQGGPALGLELNDAYPLSTGFLAPGDALVLFTDGVTEAFDARGVAFGAEGLRRVVADTPADALTALPEQLVETVERFTAGGAPRDDLAVLVVQFAPMDVDVSGADRGVWRLTVSCAPGDAARARRRIEGILRARDVAEAAIDHCLGATADALARAARGDGGGAEIEMRVEVHLPPDEIRIRIEATGSPLDPPSPPDRELEVSSSDGRGVDPRRPRAEGLGRARMGAADVLTLRRTPRDQFFSVAC